MNKEAVSARPKKVRADVLVAVFPNAISLENYITLICGAESASLISPNDHVNYIDLMRDTMVVPELSFSGRSAGEGKDINGPPMFSIPLQKSKEPLRDIVNRAIASMIRGNNSSLYKDQNCLTLGYRRKSSFNEAAGMRSNIDQECYFINTVHNLVINASWRLLVSRVGEQILRHILTRPIFSKTVNGCYIQICGTLASDLVYQNRILTASAGRATSARPYNYKSNSNNMSGGGSRDGTSASAPTTSSSSSSRSDFSATWAEKTIGIDRAKLFNWSSTAVPRYKLFYNAYYEKRAGLPSAHFFNSDVIATAAAVATAATTTTTANAATRALVSEEVSYMFKKYMSVVTYSSTSVHPAAANVRSTHFRVQEILRRLIAGLKGRYTHCDILFSLNKFCPIIPLVESTRDSGITSTGSCERKRKSDYDVPVLVGKKKKTRRGRRAGKSVQLRKKDNLSNSSSCGNSGSGNSAANLNPTTTATASSSPVHDVLTFSHLNDSVSPHPSDAAPAPARVGNATISLRPRKHSRLTRLVLPEEKNIGDVLRKNLTASIAIDEAFRSEGFLTQEDDVLFPSLEPAGTETTGKIEKHFAHPLTSAGINSSSSSSDSIKDNSYSNSVSVQLSKHARKKKKRKMRLQLKLMNQRLQRVDATANTTGTGTVVAHPFELLVDSAPSTLPSADCGAFHHLNRLLAISATKATTTTTTTTTTRARSSFSTSSGSAIEANADYRKRKRVILDDNDDEEKEGDDDDGHDDMGKTKQDIEEEKEDEKVEDGEGMKSKNQTSLLCRPPPAPPAATTTAAAATTAATATAATAATTTTANAIIDNSANDRFEKDRAGVDNPAKAVEEFFLKSDSLLDLSTPLESVSEFTKSVCRRVFCREHIWGSAFNQSLFLRSIALYVSLGRHETLTVSRLVDGMRLGDVPWLNDCKKALLEHITEEMSQNQSTYRYGRQEAAAADATTAAAAAAVAAAETVNQMHSRRGPSPSASSRSNNSSEPPCVCCNNTPHETAAGDRSPPFSDSNSNTNSNSAKDLKIARKHGNDIANALVTNIFSEFIHWIFAEFITPLLSVCFYATEVEGRGFEVLFYRKQLWGLIVQKGLEQMKTNFLPVLVATATETTATSSNTIAASTINGVRDSKRFKRPAELYTASGVKQIDEDHFRRSSCTSTVIPTIMPPKTSSFLFNDLLRAKHKEILSSANIASHQLSLQQQQQQQQRQQPQQLLFSGRKRGRATSTDGGHRRKGAVGVRGRGFISMAMAHRIKQLPSVRFVPKRKTVRAITNLRTAFKRSASSSSSFPSSGIITTAATTTTTTAASSSSSSVAATNLAPLSTAASSNSNSNSNSSSSSSIANGAIMASSADIGGVPQLSRSAIYNCLHVMRHECNCNPELAGFGALGIDDLYLKLKAYKRTLLAAGLYLEQEQSLAGGGRRREGGGRRGQLRGCNISQSSSGVGGEGEGEGEFYVAALDLEKCFDNIDTAQLYDLWKRILLRQDEVSAGGEKTDLPASVPPATTSATGAKTAAAASNQLDAEMMIHKYMVTYTIPSLNKTISKAVRHVAIDGDIIPFAEASNEVARRYRNSCISDSVVYTKVTRGEILRNLKVHLFNHVVRIPPARSGAPVMMQMNNNNNNKPLSSTTMETAAAAAAAAHYPPPTTTTAAATTRQQGVPHHHQQQQRMLKDGQSCYTQVRGIPQGSVLSPILCNTYFASAEKAVFGTEERIRSLGLTNKSVIMRLMDDYIMVSTEKRCVQNFLLLAHQALKPYGGTINHVKTRVNFDAHVDVNGERVKLTTFNNDAAVASGTATPTVDDADFSYPTAAEERSAPLISINNHWMPWCGFLLNTHTLEVRPDFTRLLSRPLTTSISMEMTGRPQQYLCKAIKMFIRTKCTAIVLDGFLNRKETVCKSLYTCYLVAAMRTCCVLKKLNFLSSRIHGNGRRRRRSIRNEKGTVLPLRKRVKTNFKKNARLSRRRTGTTQRWNSYRYNATEHRVYRAVSEGLLYGSHLIHSATRSKTGRKLSLGTTADKSLHDEEEEEYGTEESEREEDDEEDDDEEEDDENSSSDSDEDDNDEDEDDEGHNDSETQENSNSNLSKEFSHMRSSKSSAKAKTFAEILNRSFTSSFSTNNASAAAETFKFGRCDVSSSEALWLGFTAFSTIFAKSKKQPLLFVAKRLQSRADRVLLSLTTSSAKKASTCKRRDNNNNNAEITDTAGTAADGAGDGTAGNTSAAVDKDICATDSENPTSTATLLLSAAELVSCLEEVTKGAEWI